MGDSVTENFFIDARNSGIFSQGSGRCTKFTVQTPELAFRVWIVTKVWTAGENMSIVDLWRPDPHTLE